MNVKLIFVFVICVVLPIGLYSEDIGEHAPAKDEEEEYRETLLDHWMPCKNGTFEEDDDENLYIRVFVQPSSKKSDLFMIPNMTRIGVNITTPTCDDEDANMEVTDYFAYLFQVVYSAVTVEDGMTDNFKTLKVTFGRRDTDYVIRKIVEKYVEQKYGK